MGDGSHGDVSGVGTMGASTGARRCTRLQAVGVLLILFVLAGCSNSPGPPSSNSMPTSSVMSDVTRTSGSTPTPSERSSSTEPEPEPETEPWAEAEAEEVCAELYAGRGVPPYAESRDLDDQMALEADWHSDLLADAVGQLESVDVDAELVDLMAETAALQQRAAQLYAEHVIVSQELNDILARLDELGDDVLVVADEADAPSCAALVVDP